MAVAIKDQLKDIGIDVSVQVIASSPDFEQDKSEKKFEAWVDDSTPIIADLAYEGLLVYHSTGGLINFHSYDNARVNELIDLSLATAEGPERDDLIRELHDITQEEIPWVTLVERVSGEATDKISATTV